MTAGRAAAAPRRPAARGRSGWRGLAADVRRAESPAGRRQLECFAIEGFRLHERALRARAPIEAVVVARGLFEDPRERAGRLLTDLAASGCRIEIAPDAEVERLTEGRGNGPLVGLVRLAPPPELASVLRDARERPATLVAGVEIEDPGNVGALVRTALAAGAAAFAAVGVADPYHPRAVRTSMGSLFKLPLLLYAEAADLLDDLGRSSWLRLAAASGGGAPLPEAEIDVGRDVAVLLGSEAFGLPDAVRRNADRLVTVPMAAEVDSYSVNAAAAVILYEIARRRTAG